MQKPLWQPTKQQIEQSNMWLFLHFVQDNYDHNVHDYSSLYEWSIKYTEQFWPAVFQFCHIEANTAWDSVLESGNSFADIQWFKGCKLNFAKNLLRSCNNMGNNTDSQDEPAIIFWGENKVRRSLSYKQLYQQVAQLAGALKSTGVSKGDRVAGFMPNLPESVIAMLATTSIGAIWSSCSPDFGYQGIMDRFAQIEPKILFTADGYYFKGKRIDSLTIAKNVASAIHSIKQLIVVPYLDDQPNVNKLHKATLYDNFLVNTASSLEFEMVPFNHPLYIMYSSGTTGIPKCIVHSVGGTLIQHLKELILHTDLKPGDRIFYFTTCGWMMWNWLVSSLATGATIMLYDGNPFHPKPDVLMDYIEQEKINIFGSSAKYISALENAGVTPRLSHDLGSLRSILSTGSPLAPESFDYVYNHIKPDIQLASISGGTDIISCFALGNPILPVYKGELQCRGLGMDVDVFNESGQSVRSEKGELVCKSPFPSMPIYFWNDADKKKYKAAYFEKYNDHNQPIWAHGDFAELTSHNGLIIYGRSDAILNPGGVRIGTAEIYRQVEKCSEVLESIAVGQDWQNDVRIILFVKLQSKIKLDETLVAKIIKTIKDNTTPRHVPAKLIQIDDIPRTISGKISELAVRNVIHNLPVKNLHALANPEALALFKNLNELQS